MQGEWWRANAGPITSTGWSGPTLTWVWHLIYTASMQLSGSWQVWYLHRHLADGVGIKTSWGHSSSMCSSLANCLCWKQENCLRSYYCIFISRHRNFGRWFGCAFRRTIFYAVMLYNANCERETYTDASTNCYWDYLNYHSANRKICYTSYVLQEADAFESCIVLQTINMLLALLVNTEENVTTILRDWSSNTYVWKIILPSMLGFRKIGVWSNSHTL